MGGQSGWQTKIFDVKRALEDYQGPHPLLQWPHHYLLAFASATASP